MGQPATLGNVITTISTAKYARGTAEAYILIDIQNQGKESLTITGEDFFVTGSDGAALKYRLDKPLTIAAGGKGTATVIVSTTNQNNIKLQYKPKSTAGTIIITVTAEG